MAVSMTLPPEPVVDGTVVTIDVVVRNAGEVSGNYTASLKMDGSDVESKNVSIGAGQSQTISFTMTPEKQGSYLMELDDASGTLLVEAIPISSAVLTEADLPPFFNALTLEELGLSEADFAGYFGDIGGNLHDYFAFLSGDSQANFEMVLGFHIYPLTTLDQVSFNIGIDDTDSFLEDIIAGLEGAEVISAEIVPGLGNMDDKSAGYRISADFDGVEMMVDMAMFRNEEVVTILYVYWLVGYNPAVPSTSIPSIIDERVAAALATR